MTDWHWVILITVVLYVLWTALEEVVGRWRAKRRNVLEPRERPELVWEDYFMGSARAAYDGGHFLVIPLGKKWRARFDRNGHVEWVDGVEHPSAAEAQAACKTRVLIDWMVH